MSDPPPRYEEFSSLASSSARVAPPPPARSKRKSYLIIAGILMVPVVVCCCGGGLFLVGVFSGALERDLPAGQAERDVVIDVDDVALWSEGFAFQPELELLRKIRHFDGSHEVEYEYDHPIEEEPFYLSCSSSVENSSSDAEMTYKLLGGTVEMLVPLMAGEGAELVVRNDQFSWGDASEWSDFQVDGVVVGHVFIGRKGSRVMLMMLVGVYFETPEVIEAFVGPTLANLENYVP